MLYGYTWFALTDLMNLKTVEIHTGHMAIYPLIFTWKKTPFYFEWVFMHVFWFNSFPMMLRETAASMGRCSLKVETSSQHVPNLHCQHWGMDAFANIADQGFQSLARTWHVSRWNWCQWNIGEWGWWGRAIRTTDVFFLHLPSFGSASHAKAMDQLAIPRRCWNM